jgi:hypothetical protein
MNDEFRTQMKKKYILKVTSSYLLFSSQQQIFDNNELVKLSGGSGSCAQGHDIYIYLEANFLTNRRQPPKKATPPKEWIAFCVTSMGICTCLLISF